MRLETILNKKDKYRIHTLTGEFDFETLFKALVRVYDDENFDPTLNSIWNLSDLRGIESTTSDQIRKITSFVTSKREQYGSLKTALVVSNKVHFGIWYQTEMAKGRNIRRECINKS